MRTLLTILISSVALAAPEESTFESKGLTLLQLNNGAGNTVIQGTDAPQAKVIADKLEWGDHCKLSINRKDESLVVKVDSGGIDAIGKTNCRVDFKVEVPKTIAMRVGSGSGDITVLGTKGVVDYKLGSGDFKADAELTGLKGMTGSGNVQATKLSGNASIRNGSGNVKLTFATLPEQGGVDIWSGSGNGEVVVPKDAKFTTQLLTGSGKLKNELADTKDAKFRISMKGGSGDLIIKAGN